MATRRSTRSTAIPVAAPTADKPVLAKKRPALGAVNANSTTTVATLKGDGKPAIRRSTRQSISSSIDTDGDAVMNDPARPVRNLRVKQDSKSRIPLGGKSNLPRRATAPASDKDQTNAAVKRTATNAIKRASTAAPKNSRKIEVAQSEEDEPVVTERRQSKRFKTSEPDISSSVAPSEQETACEEVSDDANVVARHLEGWADLDDGDDADPLMVAEYVNEVYDYIYELELKSLPDGNYMERQTEVTWKMRGILVDWLVEVHTKFRLLPETIFLAVNIIDRFLSIRHIALIKFQLVGITALFIAAKYEEIVCPSIQNFLYMTDGGFTDDEILKAERYLLQQIGFDLSYPNPINFLRRISKADDYDMQTRTIAKYLMEIAIVERKLVDTKPSMIAAASMWLARKVLDRGDWDINLVHYSNATQKQLLPTAQIMLDYILKNRGIESHDDAEHPHLHKKYANRKFYKASEVCLDWAVKQYPEAAKLGDATNKKRSTTTRKVKKEPSSARLEEWDSES